MARIKEEDIRLNIINGGHRHFRPLYLFRSRDAYIKTGKSLLINDLPDFGRDDLTRTDDPHVPNVVR